MARTAVVTGAFSNVGRAAARVLVERGWDVRTLTNRPPARDDLPLERRRLRFDPAHLLESLAGADVLLNTYWVRHPAHGAPFEEAIRNSEVLLEAARAAGVPRVVQLSVSNASEDGPTPYWRGKAAVERAVRERARSWAILRPTMVVGPRDVLTNNIAWWARRLPVVPVPGGAEYPLQPVTLEDTARILADEAEGRESRTRDVAGPERFRFRDYVLTVSRAVRGSRLVAPVPSALFGCLATAGGVLLADVLVSADELKALRAGALVSHEPPLGTRSVRSWLEEHGASLGRRYVNDRRTRSASSRAARPAAGVP